MMSAPALNRNGLEEAITSACTSLFLTLLHTLPRSSMTCGEIEFICPLASHAIATPSGQCTPLSGEASLHVCSLTTWVGGAESSASGWG